jgi:hypothetical protein
MELLSRHVIRNIVLDAVTEQDETMKMSGGAGDLLIRTSTVFIHYLSALVYEFPMSAWRRTLGRTDILDALNDIGMFSLADDEEYFLNRFSFSYIYFLFFFDAFPQRPTKDLSRKTRFNPLCPLQIAPHSFTLFSFISYYTTHLFSRRRN